MLLTSPQSVFTVKLDKVDEKTSSDKLERDLREKPEVLAVDVV